jgi:putative zinc finger/helix-turn-helix YgiT family protein
MELCHACGEKLTVVKDKPYHYDECGLDVMLLGITQYTCDSCGESYASIPNIQRLNRVIGNLVCEKRKALLRPEEIKFLRKDLQLKAKELAQTLGVTPQTVSRWENGKKEIGEAHDRLLRSIYMMCASERKTDQSCIGFIDIFKGLPHDRKKIIQPKEISLNPQEWLGGMGGFCIA